VQTSITSSDTASSHHHRRDADDFAREIKARKATEQDELSQDNPSSDINVINAAQEAAHRLLTGQAWQDWVAVGRALLVGRTEAMRTANTNKPTGKLYAAQFGQWLTAAKLDKVADKATRSRLLNLLDHIDEVEAWRATLATNKQLELNHPNTVWRHWQKATVVPTMASADKPLSPVAKLKESLAASQEEVHRLKEANGGNQFTSKDTPKSVVLVLQGTFSISKLKVIRTELGKLIQASEAEAQ
jgi:hypothetical protein